MAVGIVSSRDEASDPNAPKDSFHIAKLTFFFLGCGLLLPYNAFISASDYYEILYPCGHVIFYFATTYMVTLFSFMLVAVAIGEKISFNIRILPCYIAFFLVLIGSMLTKTLWIHIFLVIITGIADAIVQQAVYSLGSVFPVEYMSYLCSGQAAAGTVITIIRVCSLAVASSPKASFEFFIGLSSGIVGLCIIGWLVLVRTTYGKYYLQFTRTGRGAVKLEMSEVDEQKDVQLMRQEVEVGHEEEGGEGDDLSRTLRKNPFDKYRSIARPLLLPALSILLNFSLTLALFPGIAVEMKSSSQMPNFTVALIGVFNVGDLVSRGLANIRILRINMRSLCILSVARFVFIPLFLLRGLPDLPFNLGDPFAFVIMALFALSNGYVCAVGMMQAPKCVSLEYQEATGTYMAFTLMVGLTIGAITGMILASALYTSAPCLP